jgi:hypothetical protein
MASPRDSRSCAVLQRVEGHGRRLHARAKDAQRRSQSYEEDRYMQKSDMIAAEGEIAAVDQGGVRHAEG